MGQRWKAFPLLNVTTAKEALAVPNPCEFGPAWHTGRTRHRSSQSRTVLDLDCTGDQRRARANRARGWQSSWRGESSSRKRQAGRRPHVRSIAWRFANFSSSCPVCPSSLFAFFPLTLFIPFDFLPSRFLPSHFLPSMLLPSCFLPFYLLSLFPSSPFTFFPF